ncbi:Iron hydrogenase 1 [bioreactor metagenome]|uniref:Iron hydrogenase 1 n=1 Tax=bioreactor metagenome TaxID=1076179 RepID=A0A645BA07_9ZZZZ
MTGGVTEAVVRRLSSDKSISFLRSLAFKGVRGMQGVKETTVPYGDKELKIAVVSGLKNADNLIKKIKSGEKHYDFIEVMACPGGCINGAGQPFSLSEERKNRGNGLYKADSLNSIKRSEENPLVMSLYNGLLKGKVHKLLHVDYIGKEGDRL